MTTVKAYIEENQIGNYMHVENLTLETYTKEGQKIILDSFPFKLYKKEKLAYGTIPINIPIERYGIFLINGLIER